MKSCALGAGGADAKTEAGQNIAEILKQKKPARQTHVFWDLTDAACGIIQAASVTQDNSITFKYK
jgi:hypothetical protein